MADTADQPEKQHGCTAWNQGGKRFADSWGNAVRQSDRQIVPDAEVHDFSSHNCDDNRSKNTAGPIEGRIDGKFVIEHGNDIADHNDGDAGHGIQLIQF